METKLNIGLFGIGLDTYWGQFEGLLDKLSGYQKMIGSKLTGDGTMVIDAGMVDNPGKAADAVRLFRQKEVDIVFLYISTYALSSTVLPVVRGVNVPVIILNLQPSGALDYKTFNAIGDRGIMTGIWLENCQACCVPEISSVLLRANIPFHLISGYLSEDYVWNEVSEWLTALKVVKGMRENRVGLLGHYYCGMLDVYSDLTRHSAVFGNHFEIIEFGTLKKLRDEAAQAEIKNKTSQFRDVFNVSEECTGFELERAARTSVALDKMAEKFHLGSLAYYYEGAGDESYEDIVTSLIPGFTLLTGNHVPVAGEYEVKNVQAMKIMDLLNAGGSFSEFYGLDYLNDTVLLGHDGPAHFQIADGKVGLVPVPVFHGKPGKGLSIQMKVRNGPVTVLSVCQDREGSIFLLVAEGESVAGETLQIGNTNSRYRFRLTARDFIDQWSKAGPSHHCAIGTGHQASVLEKLAQLLGIRLIRIC
jgi:L-arabinose isomerase